MKILVLSDSHSALRTMRLCIQALEPDAVIHLGDYFDDGAAMAEEFPHIRFWQVPGNCDKYRAPVGAAQTLIEKICGVKLFMTHGHIHRVKAGLGALIADARTTGVQAVLFGHTHMAHCEQEADGLWVVNPGSCGFYGGSAALMEVRDGVIADCRIVRVSELDAPV